MAIRIKVSELLGRHKMTQKELSQKTGIRPGTVSALYHETIKRLEIEHLDKICAALNCQPGDLFEYIPTAREENQNAASV
ncbi:MAG: helix-turn-helix domain-containing protein [Bacillota bacterium]|uniref:helix-turn-helix domain-containing protein n=1 Tax=Desulfurispora thermophila TaxID=265470 RepID=UPI000380259D|nr:helix-turn-helix transcriptional regulator [Desulfurispora thermophila]